MTDFSQAPYFNDFAPEKQYIQILFRPERSIQARELNFLQDIFKHQVSRFGNHMFKNGAKISNARMAVLNYKFIVPAAGETIPTLVEGDAIYGTSSQQLARFVVLADEFICLMFDGTNSSMNSMGFFEGEIVDVHDKSGVFRGSFRLERSSYFQGDVRVFSIDEGVFFYNGNFLENKRQILALPPFGVFDVGLKVEELVIDEGDDPSLLDPNPNPMSYMNVGADRLQYKLTLEKRDRIMDIYSQAYNLFEGTDTFIVLATFNQQDIKFMKGIGEYADFGEMLAQRTYEESGNYTVDPFKIIVKEHKAAYEGDPSGLTTQGSEENFVVELDSGVGYVRGHRVESLTATRMLVKKARQTLHIDGFAKTFHERSYIRAVPRANTSAWPNNINTSIISDLSQIEIYDGVANISNQPTGTLIGYMKISDACMNLHTTETTPRPIYKYYITEISMLGNHTISEAKTLYRASATFVADVLADDVIGTPTIYLPGKNELVWEIEKPFIKSLRDSDDPTIGSITLYKRKKLKGTLDSAGNVSFKSQTNEYFKGINNNTICIMTKTGVNKNIELTSSNSSYSADLIEISLGSNNSGATITLLADIIISNMTEKVKEVTDRSQTFPSISDPIVLDRSDVISFTAKMYDPLVALNMRVYEDITDLFTLYDGQTDYAYINSSLTRNQKTTTLDFTNKHIQVDYTYFHHVGDQGYFTVDSYSSIPYVDIPSFKAKSGIKYRLADCFDFRPLVLSGTISSTSVLPAPQGVAIFDVEYYVGRIDSVCARKDGALLCYSGTPSETPVPPVLENDHMVLHQLTLKPFTFDIKKDITIKTIENRRYTMRDINVIEDRLKTIEYYTALTLLEKSAADMSIKDVNGLDKFKNGFVVDDFRKFQAADLTSNEFRSAIDSTRRELVPRVIARNRTLELDANMSGNYTLIQGMMYMPFVSEVMQGIMSATKSLSINPYYQVSVRGTLTINPNVDAWTDTTTEPAINVTVDTGMVDSLTNFAAYTGADNVVGSWSESNRTFSRIEGQTARDGGFDVFDVTETRTITSVEISSKTNDYNLGTRVTDVSLDSFLRTQDVEFTASRMAPDTDVFAFFDDVAVTEHTRPWEGLFGDQLRTDANGECRGVFRIPHGTFFVGQRTFMLTGDPENRGQVDYEFTKAKAVYYGAGLNVSKQETNMQVITPEFSTNVTTEDRQVEDRVERPDPPPPPPPPAPPPSPPPAPRPSRPPLMDGLRRMSDRSSDPIAQSFRNMDSDGFVTGIDLYFERVDTTSVGVWVELRTMLNGYPTEEVLAHTNLDVTAIGTSNDSSVKHHVDFTFPVYIEARKEYCFVVGGWSPGTRVWVSRIGEPSIEDPDVIIEENNAFGSSFRSQNGSTWTAEQYEDIKHEIYWAKFDNSKPLIASFTTKDEADPLELDPFETEIGVSKVRVYAKNHGVVKGDSVKLSMFKEFSYSVTVPAGSIPAYGQQTITDSGSGIITDIVRDDTDETKFTIKIKDLRGTIQTNQTITFTQHEVTSVDGVETTITTQFQGTVTNAPVTEMAGVDLNEINDYVTVSHVDSNDSFVIDITSIPDETGRWGGSGCEATHNIRYEIFNATVEYEKYSCVENWTLSSSYHGTDGGPFEYLNYMSTGDRNITLGSDFYNDPSYKMVCDIDVEQRGISKTRVSGVFISASERVSPVLNTGIANLIMVTNKVGGELQSESDVEPNSVGRWKDETDAANGSHDYKYVTQQIILARPASDLLIAFDVFKDKDADFDVYIKTKAQYSQDNIDDYEWKKVNIATKRHSVNLEDRIEYELTCSELVTNMTTPFIAFKVKIVGRTMVPSRPPLFQSLRCIAFT